MNTSTKVFGIGFATAMIIALSARTTSSSAGFATAKNSADQSISGRQIPSSNFDILREFGVVIEPKPQYLSVRQVAPGNTAAQPTNNSGWLYEEFPINPNITPETSTNRISQDELPDAPDQEDPESTAPDSASDGTSTPISNGSAAS